MDYDDFWMFLYLISYFRDGDLVKAEEDADAATDAARRKFRDSYTDTQDECY